MEMERTLNIEKKYLIFPVNTREELNGVTLSLDGQTLYDIDLRASSEPNLMTWLEVGKWRGHTLKLASDTLGEEILAHIRQSDRLPDEDTCYRECLRPRLHYTQRCGWVNDPNGLVYCEGKYHLFYQHNPYDTRWGNMHWGHAVSSDLVHWRELPEALYPDDTGTMFSGCAVYDQGNVSGLGKEGRAPLLLYYTAAGCTNRVSDGKNFTVCIAYSTDGGESFVKYGGNPVLENFCYGNRDPKIIWHAPSKRWVMTLFLQAYDFAFFSSADLIHWRYESQDSFPPLNECPDVFPLGDTGKWVLLAGSEYWGDGSVGKYYIGAFDGKFFRRESGPHLVDFGKEFYSLQTFDNAPEGRRILMGWRTRNFHIPEREGMPFNGEFSLPNELTPCEIDGQLRLARMPVREFFQVPPEDVLPFAPARYSAVKRDLTVFSTLPGEACYLDCDFALSPDALLEFNLGGHSVIYSAETQTLQCLSKNIRVPLEDGRLRLVLVRDVVSLEVYAQGGKYPAGGYVAAHNGSNSLMLYRGEMDCRKLNFNRMKSIWE